MTTSTNLYPIRSSLTYPLPHLAYPFSYPYLLSLTSHTYLPTLPPSPYLLPLPPYAYLLPLPRTPTPTPYPLPAPLRGAAGMRDDGAHNHTPNTSALTLTP